MRRLAPLVACALLLAGCGLGPGKERNGGAELRVTRDFGHEVLGRAREARVREDQTVMRFLRSRFDVETRYGGRYVESIDGISGRGAGGRVDWFYFVNGIEADVGAAEYELSPGDVVQWDYRRWDAAMRVPAIVGAFPEPFVHGRGGKRLPTRVECEDAAARACEAAKRRLRAVGVAATGASLGATGARNVIRVVVGRWRAIRALQVPARLEQGPGESGVFGRFVQGGRALELLDAAGRPARRAPPRTGLVAALSPSDGEIVWVVTALDVRGLEAAARALEEPSLRNAYAVAVTPRGVEKLPLGGSRR
jgi:Domain of unknown function (DUF4430)